MKTGRYSHLGRKMLAVTLACMMVISLALTGCGSKNEDGKDGKSAYELAVENGYKGTEFEWLASLAGEAGEAGADGESAYELAVKHGYAGSEEQWLKSLVGETGKDGEDGEDGEDGKNGKSAYELACKNGFTGDLAAWLDYLAGDDGVDGVNGKNGKSAYELAVENGFRGSVTQWLASLVGATGEKGSKGDTGDDGKSAYEVACENGYQGTQQEWLASLVGATGQDGKSAYELAVARGYQGTEEEWLSNLAGKDGLSAYEIAVKNGFVGDEAAWLASLKGEKGDKGDTGAQGEQGIQGVQGIGVASAYVNSELHLILVLTDGTEIDAGYVGVVANYNVTFKDWDGTVLKTQTVDVGKAATAPAAPSREGYTFAGWNKSFNVVTSDLVVTAVYTSKTTKPVIQVESATVMKGTSEATVKVRVRNNPGIMGGEFSVRVDDAVFGFKSAQKVDCPSLAVTYSGAGVTASPYKILLDAMELTDADRDDGVLFTITLTIKDPNATGSYAVNLSYDAGATFDEYYNYLNLVVENGTITIE